VSRYRTALASTYFAYFVVPLILASLARPFGFWDYLTDSDVFHYEIPIQWSTLIPNSWNHFVTANYILRPVTVFIYDLQVLLFGGQFWLWYAVKWAAYFGAITLAVWTVRRLGCGWAAQISVASLLLFHHARFTLMLHAPDGWVALGAIAQLALLSTVYGDIAKLCRWSYAAFLFLALFAMGAKETGYVIETVLCAFLLWNNYRAFRLVLPLVLLIVVWTVRLLGLTHRASEKFSVGAWIGRLSNQIEMLIPGSPDRLLDICAFGLAIYACVLAWRWRHEYRGRLIVFSLVTTAGVLAFTTMPPLAGLRYGIPAVFILSVSFGLAIDAMSGRMRNSITALMIVVFPVITAGQIYTQEVAYHQQFFACSHMLNTLDREAKQGATLALTGFPGDFGGESASTVKYYFGKFGAMWYGVTPRVMHSVAEKGWPASRFALLSIHKPEVLFKEGPKPLSPERLDRVIAVVPGKHGALSRLQERYAVWDALLRVRTAHAYDFGAPVLNGGPVLYIYLAHPETTKGDGKWIMEEVTAPKTAGAF
jgi:hypothetical protein